MRLRFNGAQAQKRTGCPVCGGRKTVDGVTFSKSYILPSGQAKIFTAGRIYEVSEKDGRFLLSYVFKEKDGTVRPSFEKV